MRTNKRRLGGLLILVPALILLISCLAIWFYRPTPQSYQSVWQSEDAPSLAAGRREGVYNLLLVGRDRASSATDVMALVSFDTINERATLLQLPRDTLVRMNGAAMKLNAVFAKEKAAVQKHNEKDADFSAVLALGKWLETELCISIDYHALLYLDGFVELVDTIGGVRVDVPFAMHYDDPAQNLHIHLEAGEQLLDGHAAESFVRFRKSSDGGGYTMGDLGRLDMQKRFAAALLSRIRELSPAEMLPLAKTALAHVKTDLGLSDTVYFARHAARVDPADAVLFTIPGNTVGNYYVMNRAGMHNVLNEFFNVYDSEIPVRVFDKNEFFNLPSDRSVNARYHLPPPQTERKSAADLLRS